jgi:hypothetical protein
MLMPPISIANIARVTTSRAALVPALLLAGRGMSVGLAAAAAVVALLVLWAGSWSVFCFPLASVDEEPGLARLLKPPIELKSQQQKDRLSTGHRGVIRGPSALYGTKGSECDALTRLAGLPEPKQPQQLGNRQFELTCARPSV